MESQSIEQDEVGKRTQDTASENQDSFEETLQVFASQTSTEKSAAPPSHGSLSGKRKHLQDLSEATSEHQVNQSILQVTEEDEFDAFGRSLALGLNKLPLNLAVQCQNDLQATLSRYRFRAFCESSLSPASTCDSGATETSLHCYDFLQQSVQTSTNIPAQRENVGEENFTFSY